MAAVVTLRMTSFGSWTLGSSTSLTSSLNGPWNVTAFMQTDLLAKLRLGAAPEDRVAQKGVSDEAAGGGAESASFLGSRPGQQHAVAPRKAPLQHVGGHGPAEEVTLHLEALPLLQELQLLLGLHSLGDDPQLQAVGHGDDGGGDS